MINQGTDEWLQERCGCITGSRIADMLAGGNGITRKKYLYKLSVERLTGQALQGGYTNERMEQGNLLEPEARNLYSLLNDVDVNEVGFIKHPTIEWYGASPDGLIGDDGLLELKNRDVHIHLDLMESRKPPRAAMLQMYCQLSISGRQWVDYCSYNAALPPKLRLITVRVERDEQEIRALEKAVKEFNLEINKFVEKMRSL